MSLGDKKLSPRDKKLSLGDKKLYYFYLIKIEMKYICHVVASVKLKRVGLAGRDIRLIYLTISEDRALHYQFIL